MDQHPTGRHRVLEWLEERLNLTEVFSLLSIFGFFYREVDTRKPLLAALKEALSRPLPSYSRWPRALGILVLILFLFEAVTGGLLSFYYRPTPEAAHESVRIIMGEVNFGWFVRQMHFWGAQLLLLILIVRLIRFFFRGLYRSPRELIWVCGVLMFLVGTHLDFSGRLLSWDNESYWSSMRALDVLLSMPLVGPCFDFLIAASPGEAFLVTRFYFLHIVILPLVFWGLLYFSFSGVRRVGLSEISGDETRTGRSAYLSHLNSLLIMVLLIFGVLVTLSVLLPRPFGEPVDLFRTPGETHLAWYLLAPYGLVEFLPHWIPVSLRSGLLLALLLIFLFLPLVDLRSRQEQSQRKLALAAGIFVLLSWLFLTWYGLMADLQGPLNL